MSGITSDVALKIYIKKKFISNVKVFKRQLLSKYTFKLHIYLIMEYKVPTWRENFFIKALIKFKNVTYHKINININIPYCSELRNANVHLTPHWVTLFMNNFFSFLYKFVWSKSNEVLLKKTNKFNGKIEEYIAK